MNDQNAHLAPDVAALLERRQDIWLALSPLWLEREPREAEYQHMAEVVEAQELSFQELEKLYRLEMAPVLVREQVSMTPNFKGFDDNQLLSRLLQHTHRLTRGRRMFWLLFSGLATMPSRHRYGNLLEILHLRGNTPR